MSRRADPLRIEVARRAAAIARLVGAGELPDRAATAVARWEATIDGLPHRSDWEALDRWLGDGTGTPLTMAPVDTDISGDEGEVAQGPASQGMRPL